MQAARAKQILERLLDGFDPVSGEPLPEESPIMHRDVMRAISSAIGALVSVNGNGAGPHGPAREVPTHALIAETVPNRRPLTSEEERTFEELLRWRNARALEDGLDANLIAQNRHLHDMVTLPVRTLEDLRRVKGFGEKRAERYAGELLPILQRRPTPDPA